MHPIANPRYVFSSIFENPQQAIQGEGYVSSGNNVVLAGLSIVLNIITNFRLWSAEEILV